MHTFVVGQKYGVWRDATRRFWSSKKEQGVKINQLLNWLHRNPTCQEKKQTPHPMRSLLKIRGVTEEQPGLLVLGFFPLALQLVNDPGLFQGNRGVVSQLNEELQVLCSERGPVSMSEQDHDADGPVAMV